MTEAAFTAEDLLALDRAIAKGVKIVKYTDKEITYRTLEEMLQIRDFMNSCINGTKRGLKTFAQTSKGFC